MRRPARVITAGVRTFAAIGMLMFSAVSAAHAQDPVSASAQTRAPYRPVVAQHEWALGATVSYATLESADTNFGLVLDHLDLRGSMFSVNPSAAYFVRPNLALGVRLGYAAADASLSNAALNLGMVDLDVDVALSGIEYRNRALSGGIFMRSYAGLDPRGTFALFGEVELAAEQGDARFSYSTGGVLHATDSRRFQMALRFNPGLAVFLTPNLCTTVSVGLGGIEYTRIRQHDEAGALIGRRDAGRMRMRLNLLNINIGMNFHLWNQKGGRA